MKVFKNCIAYSILSIAILYLCYCVYLTVTQPLNKTFKDSGIIVSKSNDEVPIKYGSETVLYLNIQFEKSGFRSMRSDPTTYFKYNKGQRLTYDLRENSTFLYAINWHMGVFVIFAVCVVSIIVFFKWLTMD